MSDVVIRAEGLGKKYLIGRRSAGHERYTALRDIVGRSIKGLGRSTLDMIRGQQIVSGDEIEEFWALKDVSFEIKRGEVVGIIGRNGAGKSTLLKVLSRITEPSKGRIEIKGRMASLLEVGTGFHPELTGRENIYLNGSILGMRRDEIRAKFDEIVAFAEVEKFLDTPVKRYSSGMYVRLAFAVAAHLEPEILIVDEVLAVGDAEFQKKCMGKMSEVSDKYGRTVLFVSHNMAAVQALCQRAMVLRSGRLAKVGPARQVTQEYLDNTISETQQNLAFETTRHIRSICMTSNDGASRESFEVGETIVFEVELFSNPPIEHPRFGIGICALNGDRIATLHTDIQLVQRWTIDGTRRLRATWRRAPLNVGEYRVDAALWSFDREEETLIGCMMLRIESRDVYGTGRLPDPSYQGVLVPDALWCFPEEIESA